MIKDISLFFNEFLTNFHSTGAIAPSSPALAKAISRHLRQRPARPIKVLEVGPGTGAFTLKLLKQLRPGDCLDIYELNPRFHALLTRKLSAWLEGTHPVRVSLYHEDIRRMKKGQTYDFIISGLPFANFDDKTVAEIMDIYLRHLTPEGVLSYFEYLLPHRLRLRFMQNSERKRMIRLSRTLRRYIEKHQFHASQVWFNLPPARTRHLTPSPQSVVKKTR